MELSSTDTKLKRKDFFDLWRSTDPKKRLVTMIDFLKSFFINRTFNEQQEKQIKALAKREGEKIRLKWVQKQRRQDLFYKEYKEWLQEEIVLEVMQPSSNENVTPGSSGIGRPKKLFKESSQKTKLRKVKSLLEDYGAEEISFAAEVGERSRGKRDSAKLIKEICTASPKRATRYVKAKNIMDAGSKVQPYTPDEALAFFILNNFTVDQYKNTQQDARERGCNLYPSYDQLNKAKQKCYPAVETIIVTDISAEVNLQALVDHTATRLCQDVLGDVLTSLNNTLIYKWGCDGSSGHSIYKQAFADPECTDEYMFIVSFVPIRIIGDNNKIIWQNPRPSSPRFCRVINFFYKKETALLIKEECENMEKQIELLLPTKIAIQNKEVTINHQFLLTMIDGKICNVLSDNKSTQKCYICKASGKSLNLDPSASAAPDPNMYKFGISSLHAYIRTMECLLKIAYRLDIKEWQVRGTEKKNIMRQRKDIIVKKIKSEGLIIDKVRPGMGTSNDGNTARRFFASYQATANITGLDETLIYRLSIILRTIATGLDIDTEKFKCYCEETRAIYLNLYGWYIMPPTVHKILVHGFMIIRESIIPIGQMTEEAAEAKNKEIRKVRLGHTCKSSRARTNLDLIKYMLLSSDPYITLLRKLPKKKVSEYNKDIYYLLK